MTARTSRRRTVRIVAGLTTALVATLGLTANSAAASPYGGIAMSCVTASPVSEYWATGMSWNSFTSKDSYYFDHGYRIVQLDIDGEGVTAVWQPGSGTQWVKVGHVHRLLDVLGFLLLQQGTAPGGA